jgi:hypothetical protein
MSRLLPYLHPSAHTHVGGFLCDRPLKDRNPCARRGSAIGPPAMVPDSFLFGKEGVLQAGCVEIWCAYARDGVEGGKVDLEGLLDWDVDSYMRKGVEVFFLLKMSS